MKQRATLVLNLTQALDDYWNNKLSRNLRNPYPLAPVDLVRSGMVNAVNYLEQNKALGEFCSKIMKGELLKITREPNIFQVKKQVQVLGVGLARDLDWIDFAVQLQFLVTIRDVSTLACEKVAYLEEKYPNNVNVVHGQFELLWSEEESRETLLFYAAQFIQVQKRKKMREIMRLLGSSLETKVGPPYPSIYLVHPLAKDNWSKVRYEGVQFSRPKWGDSTLYSEEDLKKEAEAGLGRSVTLEILGKHNYFHQVYSFLKLSAESKG